MLQFSWLLILALVSFSSLLKADEIVLVERDLYADQLEGLVDFDDISASKLPGTRYGGRIPLRGLLADTYFAGQTPILRLNGTKTYGTNYGLPAPPLEVANHWTYKSILMALHASETPEDVVLTSRVSEPTIKTRDSAVGFGSIAIKFLDRQRVVGFDLEALPGNVLIKRLVQLRFFSIDGTLVGRPIMLSDFGRHTFATSSFQQEIKGIEFVNFGQVPFGVDEVVFELPLILG